MSADHLLAREHEDQPPGQRVVLRVEGELDVSSAVRLLEAVRVALRRRPEGLALDLQGVEFIDVAGLRALISCRRMCSAHEAAFELISASYAVSRLLDLVGLAPVFGIGDARPAARTRSASHRLSMISVARDHWSGGTTR